jgi:hypothetical protein
MMYIVGRKQTNKISLMEGGREGGRADLVASYKANTHLLSTTFIVG